MKKSGIIRRLDELGRIVIPKEIRKTLHIKEGTPLDINIADDQSIILRKFSPIMELGSIAQVAADVLYDEIVHPIYITDLDKLVACSGIKKFERDLKENIMKKFNNRSISVLKNYNDSLFVDEITIHNDIILAPICVEGDILGSIIVDYEENNDIVISNLKLTSNFISKLVY